MDDQQDIDFVTPLVARHKVVYQFTVTVFFAAKYYFALSSNIVSLNRRVSSLRFMTNGYLNFRYKICTISTLVNSAL